MGSEAAPAQPSLLAAQPLSLPALTDTPVRSGPGPRSSPGLTRAALNIQNIYNMIEGAGPLPLASAGRPEEREEKKGKKPSVQFQGKRVEKTKSKALPRYSPAPQGESEKEIY